jgi:hypothetical protein
MTGFTLAQQVLGREAQLRAMQGRFKESQPPDYSSILALAAGLVCLFMIIWLLHRWQSRRTRPSRVQPGGLYSRVMRKMGLRFWERWLLHRLARGVRAEHPAALLVSVTMYDEAVQQYCAGRGLSLRRAGDAPSFAAIRRRLFPDES